MKPAERTVLAVGLGIGADETNEYYLDKAGQQERLQRTGGATSASAPAIGDGTSRWCRMAGARLTINTVPLSTWSNRDGII